MVHGAMVLARGVCLEILFKLEINFVSGGCTIFMVSEFDNIGRWGSYISYRKRQCCGILQKGLWALKTKGMTKEISYCLLILIFVSLCIW